MAYLVNVAVRAQRDLALIFDVIHAEDSEAAVKWYEGLKDAILSLEEHPERCPQTPENAKLRHLLYGHKPYVYRVIYRITEKSKQVDVLHIRHGARQKFKRSEVKRVSRRQSGDH
jgi:plasmid stabilization system protein ParE